MYASNVRDRRLTFGVSGMLWQSSLVMYDAETESYWSHLLGRSTYGEMEGEQLKSIASVITDWESWYAKYPGTSVLWMSRTAGGFKSDMDVDWEQLVLGVELAGKQYAWSYKHLQSEGAISTELEGTPILVVLDRGTMGARIFDRRVDGQALDLRIEEGRIVAADSDQNWDSMSGRSADGIPLTPIPTVPSLRRAWLTFHPESTMFKAPVKDKPPTNPPAP